jgi:hypothetical protein
MNEWNNISTPVSSWRPPTLSFAEPTDNFNIFHSVLVCDGIDMQPTTTESITYLF